MLIIWCSSFAVLAVSPFAKEDHQSVVIGLFSPQDSIEIDRIYSMPEMISVDYIGEGASRVRIAEFSQEGSSLPEVVSVFKEHFKSQRILFLIVKWHYYLPGVDTDADYYEIHVFNASKNATPFSGNEFLSNVFGSGFDGRHEGERTCFRYKDAVSVKKKLRELESPRVVHGVDEIADFC
jgi:hypothetical protein